MVALLVLLLPQGAQVSAPLTISNTAPMTSDTSCSLMELKMGKEISRKYSGRLLGNPLLGNRMSVGNRGGCGEG